MDDRGRPSRSGRRRGGRPREPISVAGPRPGGLAAAATAVLIAATVACSGGFGVEDSDSLVIHGRLTDSATAGPVGGAEVNVTAFSGTCGSNIFSTVSASTDSTGRYGTSVINFRSGFRRCVEVQAVPPEGTGLQTGLVKVPDVPLNDDAVVDSLTVDIALDSISGG